MKEYFWPLDAFLLLAHQQPKITLHKLNLSPHWKPRIFSSVNMISDVYTCKPEAYASATKLYHIKSVSHAMFKFCEHSMYFHIHAVLQCCLLCKILRSLFNIWSPVWHKINVSCVCGIVWWELSFSFFTFFSGSSCIHSVVSYRNSFMVIRKYKNQLALKWKKKNLFQRNQQRGM